MLILAKSFCSFEWTHEILYKRWQVGSLKDQGFSCGCLPLTQQVSGGYANRKTHGAASCCVIFTSKGHWRNDCKQMAPSVSQLQPELLQEETLHSHLQCDTLPLLLALPSLFLTQHRSEQQQWARLKEIHLQIFHTLNFSFYFNKSNFSLISLKLFISLINMIKSIHMKTD